MPSVHLQVMCTQNMRKGSPLNTRYGYGENSRVFIPVHSLSPGLLVWLTQSTVVTLVPLPFRLVSEHSFQLILAFHFQTLSRKDQPQTNLRA